MATYREGTLSFPDGAIPAKLVWKHVPLAGIGGALVPGPATTVQIMVKDSKTYAATVGWGPAGLSTANPSTRRSTQHASLAMRPT
jgi:hypothetical protein